MTVIETNGLTKRFGEQVTAVDDIDLTVDEGEIFGFLGPNGAGKSTTIKLLLDLLRPTEGSASIFGLDVNEHSRRIRARTGVLPDGYAVYDHRTGREHIEWAARTKGVQEDADTILDTVGLSDAGRRRAGEYSRGMRQRLALGIALVGNPDLLILDEPSTGLDPKGIQYMRDLLREQAADGTTVFFSSHILSEVEAVSDRIGIMDGGELVAVDTLAGFRNRREATATIDLLCESIPSSLDVQSLDGVTRTTVDGQTLTVECSDPSNKADIVAHVTEQTTIRDIVSRPASLETVFNEYTSGVDDTSTVRGEPE